MDKIKFFFTGIGGWFKNHVPTKRRLIQVYAALLFNANIKGFITGRIYTGATKNLCVPSLNCYSCPGAIGACPIGALQDSLAKSDTTAPYYIIGIIALFGLILARTLCGFLCPMGLMQELLHKIKTPKLKKSRYTRLLSYLKYILLVVLVISIPLIYNGIPAFCKYICPAGTFEGAVMLLSNSNNTALFDGLGYLFSWKFILLIAFIVACIFIYRFFCRFFCPLGAILGFFNKYALIGVKLDEEKCIDCGKCLQTCKMDIRKVGDHECINCGLCIPACPTKAISWKGSKIFLRGAEVTAGAGVSVGAEESVPLAAIATSGTAASVKAAEEIAVAESAVGSETVNEGVIKPVTVTKTKARGRGFWLQFAAWTTALLVLAGALVYYNFILKDTETVVTYGVGEVCPDFTLETVYETAGAYDPDGERIEAFTLSDYLGKVVILNFWYTDCDPCKEEMPNFEEMKLKYGDSIEVVVVHSDNGRTANQVQSALNEFGWGGYHLLFTHDNSEVNCAAMLGVKDSFPVTVILNSEGVITFTYVNKLGITLLESEIQEALNS